MSVHPETVTTRRLRVSVTYWATPWVTYVGYITKLPRRFHITHYVVLAKHALHTSPARCRATHPTECACSLAEPTNVSSSRFGRSGLLVAFLGSPRRNHTLAPTPETLKPPRFRCNCLQNLLIARPSQAAPRRAIVSRSLPPTREPRSRETISTKQRTVISQSGSTRTNSATVTDAHAGSVLILHHAPGNVSLTKHAPSQPALQHRHLRPDKSLTGHQAPLSRT
jgi:hypothetical protein